MRKILPRKCSAGHSRRGGEHRIKNDLATVGSLLRLQARSVENAAAREALESATNRLNVIAQVHQHLRQVEGDVVTVDIAAYLEDLSRGLGDLLRDVRPIALRVSSDPILLPSNQAVSVGLIVNELATNAFKYAFRMARAARSIFLYMATRRKSLLSSRTTELDVPPTRAKVWGRVWSNLWLHSSTGRLQENPQSAGAGQGFN